MELCLIIVSGLQHFLNINKSHLFGFKYGLIFLVIFKVV